MANITILDTGYINPSNVGTRLSTSYMSNSGTPIELKGVSIALATKTNLDVSPLLNSFRQSEINVGSLENDVIDIEGILRKDVPADVALMFQLSRLPKTIGYKSVYYNSTDSVNKPSEQLVTMMAGTHTFSIATGTYQSIDEKTTFGLSAAYPCIHCRFESFSIAQEAGNPIIKFKLKAIRLPNEDLTEVP